MRTMFPSQEKNSKKKYQKPNILRKRSKKPAKPNTMEVYESSDTNSLVNLNCVALDENGIKHESIDAHNLVRQFDLEASPDTEKRDTYDDQEAVLETNASRGSSKLVFENDEILIEANSQNESDDMKSGDNSNPSLVNIESFFNESAGETYMLFDGTFESGRQIETLVVIDNESPENERFQYIEQNQDLISNMLPLSVVSSQPQGTNEEEVTSTSNIPSVYTSFLPPVKFKCDAPNCTKEFRSELKFKRHKNTHEQDGSIRPPRQVTVECPVKKVEADGTETGCGKIFLVRELLLKHLNEEHTLDDAFYRCEECGRRFFWASGLRAHVRAHCRRAAGETGTTGGTDAMGGTGGTGAPGGTGATGGPGLACGWPGCGRVFRQPCRLREHARAHTGDRPYPCQYPDCGWSFRSASKLVRHARRHTGERRHACPACARAFRRREHLRDHHARHHAHPRRATPCPHPGCEQSFNNMSTLYMHMKKVHKNKEPIAPATATAETIYTVSSTIPDNMFMVSLAPEAPGHHNLDSDALPVLGLVNEEPEAQLALAEDEDESQAEVEAEAEADAEADVEAEAEAEAEDEDEDEWHSARTHCTWPLERPIQLAHDAVDANLLKDDSQVDQSEGSESNTFTVRSDLFLHGNVLINEDSEHMGVGAADSLGADLGLLDAHPTIDLMQEELMYADTAADESSFRIFLLSGEELT